MPDTAVSMPGSAVNTEEHEDMVSEHYHTSTIMPSRWQDHVECHECKWSIVEAIGLLLLQHGRLLLQRLVISGCLSEENENYAWILSSNELLPEQTAVYHTNAEEADNRIWRHAIQSWATKRLIYSPDTDTYNIGLGLLQDNK